MDKYFVDEFDHPLHGDNCHAGVWSAEGDPIPTGRKFTRYDETYTEFSFTKRGFFKDTVIVVKIKDDAWYQSQPFIEVVEESK